VVADFSVSLRTISRSGFFAGGVGARTGVALGARLGEDGRRDLGRRSDGLAPAFTGPVAGRVPLVA
jgi:hypothetical protein